MMLSRATERLCRGVGIVGFSLTLMPGVSHARLSGVVAAPGVVGAAWLIALGLIGVACLAALLLLLVHGDASARRRRSAMRTRLNKIDLPAAISGIDGKVEASNPAMRAAFGDTPGDIVQMLGRGIEVDAGQIYRLVTRSREIGFAYEPVRSLQDDSTVVLSARFDEPNRLVWTVFSPERLPRIEQDRAAGSYEDAPFAHMRIDENGNTSTNPRFRETFDDSSDLPTESLHEEPSQGIRRALLLRRDGGTQLSNIITVPAAGGDPGARDIFIFPVHEGAETPGATSTLDAVPVALMRFDFKGRMLWYNVAAREMLGQDFQPGAALAEMIEPLGRPVDALIADCIANEKGRREMVRLRGGALETFLQISLTAVTLDGDPSLQAVLSDASELRLLEDKFTQSQKMEAVGKLAGGVAHDFNNVLTAISGHSDLLMLGKDALHPDYSDLMQIRQNTHRAAALVRQLLAFSRKQTLNPAFLSVQDVVSDTEILQTVAYRR